MEKVIQIFSQGNYWCLSITKHFMIAGELAPLRFLANQKKYQLQIISLKRDR